MTDQLYHYTNLEALKLILQNKTFRLSSLSKMDDLEEGETSDFQKLGRFIYISSWTNNSIESLALWGYSSGDAGIRIKMKANPFKTEKINGDVKMHGRAVEVNGEFNLGLLDIMKSKNICFSPPRTELIPVTYTDNESLLKPKVYTDLPGGTINLQTQNLGIFKRMEWKEQKEWRYRLCSMPFSVDELALTTEPGNREPLLNKIRSRSDLGFIDIPLKDDAFEGLEVLCSPYMNDDRMADVNNVLAQYAPDTVVRNSRLQIRR